MELMFAILSVLFFVLASFTYFIYVKNKNLEEAFIKYANSTNESFKYHLDIMKNTSKNLKDFQDDVDLFEKQTEQFALNIYEILKHQVQQSELLEKEEEPDSKQTKKKNDKPKLN